MKRKPIRIDGGVAFVPLSKGYEAIIDVADVPIVESFNWVANVCPTTVYARSYTSRPNRKLIHMHRLIMATPPGLFTDHIDRNGLNNRRSNLRNVTPEQNQFNLGPYSTNTSGVTGVNWHKASNKWRATISVKHKHVHLGCFETQELAKAAYLQAVSSLRQFSHHVTETLP